MPGNQTLSEEEEEEQDEEVEGRGSSRGAAVKGAPSRAAKRSRTLDSRGPLADFPISAAAEQPPHIR
jgi:hypothetical protein